METAIITFIASFLIWFLFIGVLFLSYFGKTISRRDIFKAFLSILLAVVLGQLVKLLIPDIGRPFYFNGHFPLTITVPFDSSFPSDHSAFAFALAASLWLKDKRVGFIYGLGAVVVGVGRVLAKVHFPIDIWGGAVLGIFSALLIDTLWLKLPFLSFKK